jgi:periplasmic protein CpxP/Spy
MSNTSTKCFADRHSETRHVAPQRTWHPAAHTATLGTRRESPTFWSACDLAQDYCAPKYCAQQRRTDQRAISCDRHLEKLMKRIFASLILMATSAALAGETGLQEPATGSEQATVGRSPNDVVNVLAKHLSLTEDQKSKILPIITERQRKIQEVWTSSTRFVRQKQGQVRGINEDSDKRINALLSGDQQKAYAAFEQERKLQRRLRRAQSDSSS